MGEIMITVWSVPEDGCESVSYSQAVPADMTDAVKESVKEAMASHLRYSHRLGSAPVQFKEAVQR